jgi:hypothetical protein
MTQKIQTKVKTGTKIIGSFQGWLRKKNYLLIRNLTSLVQWLLYVPPGFISHSLRSVHRIYVLYIPRDSHHGMRHAHTWLSGFCNGEIVFTTLYELKIQLHWTSDLPLKELISQLWRSCSYDVVCVFVAFHITPEGKGQIYFCAETANLRCNRLINPFLLLRIWTDM